MVDFAASRPSRAWKVQFHLFGVLALVEFAAPAIAQQAGALPAVTHQAVAQEGIASNTSRIFVERPGELEFSGLMIVRPLPDKEADECAEQLVLTIPETGELIVAVPESHDENSYAQWLMATGNYQYVEPDWLCFPTQTTPNDPSYWQQWHHNTVRSPLAWDLEIGGEEMIIAIVDGGVQLDHPDLAAALVPGYNSDDDLAQNAGGDVSDVDGHGTFVAGLAGAIGNNNAFVSGMGWNFSLMPVRYYNQPGGGYLHNILEGARWAAQNGAKCINVSQTGVEYSTVQTTGEYVRGLGSLLFWAAGNDQRDLNWFDWDDVIIVGGTDPNDDKASFSAFGKAVDVYAPATNIYSTGVPSALAIGNGTSAAAPMVAGVAALVWSHRPFMTADQVETCLFTGCVDLGATGNDSYWGWGRVDSFNTLLSAGVVDIKANQVDDHLYLVQGMNLQVEVSLEPGIFDGEYREWWISAATPSGWQHYKNSTWMPGLNFTHRGPLTPLNPSTVLDWSGLQPGNYQFYFGVDKIPNGSPDMDLMMFDQVEVTVW
jgi:subtilisin family serine protease